MQLTDDYLFEIVCLHHIPYIVYTTYTTSKLPTAPKVVLDYLSPSLIFLYKHHYIKAVDKTSFVNTSKCIDTILQLTIKGKKVYKSISLLDQFTLCDNMLIAKGTIHSPTTMFNLLHVIIGMLDISELPIILSHKNELIRALALERYNEVKDV